MWIESRVTSWPLMFRRQFAQPIDVDSVFETLAEMDTYLSNALRHIGQIATCQETEGIIYIMNNNMDAWVTVDTGSGNGILIFSSITELSTHLTNDDRIAGGIATCLETEGIIYIMNNLRTAWISIDFNSKLDSLDFYSHTGDTSVHYTKDSINISEINSAHTHSIQEIPNLQDELNSKLNLSGGTLSGTLNALTIIANDYSGITTSMVYNDTSLSGETIQDIFEDSIATEATSILLDDLLVGGRIEDINGVNTQVNKYWSWELLKDDIITNIPTDLTALNAHTGDTSIHFLKEDINISDINSAHTHTISDVINLETSLNSKLDLTGGELIGNLTAVTYYGDGSHLTGIVAGVDISLFNSHTGDTSIHFTKESINISDINSAHTHQITDIPNLQITLNNKTDLSLFNSHSATTNAHNVSFSNLISTAHTHTIANITNLQSSLDNKLNLTGGTLSGNLTGTTIVASTLSAQTYIGIDTSEVVNVSILSGNTITDVFNIADATEVFNLNSGDMLALSRMSGDTSENKMIDVDYAKSYFQTDLSPFYSHSADTSIHFTKNSINFSDLGSTAHTHSVSEISDFYNASYSASYNVTSWQEIVDILAASTVPNSVVFNVMNDIVGGTLQTYAHNIIIRGCKVTAPSTFSILGFENGIYNINFESLFYINNECVIVIGDSLLTTTTNVKFKDITSMWYNTSANYNLQCLTIGTGTTASIEYNALTNTKLDATTSLVPTQNNNYYKWNYYYDIYMFNTDSEIHFLCDRAGKFSVRCRYLCSTTTNRTITLIPPLPLKLNLHDLVTSAIETLGSYPNPIIYGTETINKFRYDTEPLSYGSSGTIFTDLNDKIEYRNNFGIGSAQYTDTGGIVDVTTSGLTLELNYTGNASGYVRKEIVITGIINRKL